MREHDKMLENLENQRIPKGDNSDVQTISRDIAKLAWLAGIIEGEGSLGMYICKGHKSETSFGRDEVQIRTVITIVNSDVLLIKKASEILFEFDVKFHFSLRRRKPLRNMLELTVDGKNSCAKLIHLIKPYLYSKLNQAELMLDLIKYRKENNIASKSKDFMQDVRLLDGIEALKRMKSNLVEPSTTLRRASQPLGLKI